jgi:hypothetical protein
LRALGAESRALLWELNACVEAFHDIGVPLLALEGAAYAAARSLWQPADLRLTLTSWCPKNGWTRPLSRAERHGWSFLPLDPYDEQYCRADARVAADGPPGPAGRARHCTTAILPRTGRLHPDAGGSGCNRAVGREGVAILSPAHTLHACVHLFQDGAVAGALRDLSGHRRHNSGTSAPTPGSGRWQREGDVDCSGRRIAP